jgi:hypothetical protein
MPAQEWSHLIAASILPVVVISATGLLCLAFYNRLAAIVSRLRLFQRERLAQQELRDKALAAKEPEHVVRHERIIELLAEQTADVMKRARLIRSTLVLCLMAIACLLVCSLLCGATVLWPALMYAAVVTFGIGLLLLLAGVSCATIEALMSLEPIALESEVVALLAP